MENETGTVRPDFLSGIYGGISMAQYHQIQQVPGVQVAAPIAMVGYAQLNASMFVPVPKGAVAGSGRQLYRISTTYVSDNGASRVTQPPSYLYVTPLRLRGSANVGDTPATDGTGPGCTLNVNTALSPGTNPFVAAAQSYSSCWSRVNQYNEPLPPGGGNGGTEAGYWVGWNIPVLIAAIDPDAEAKLDGLNKALVSGSYLKENEGDNGPDVPVLASSDSGMDEYAQTTLQQLTAPPAMPDMNAAWASAQASAPGSTVATERTTAQQAYDLATRGLGPSITVSNRQGAFTGIPFSGYRSVGPVDYQRTTAGALVPRQVVNPPSVWYTGTVASVAMDDEGSQYRTVTSHANMSAQNSAVGPAALHVARTPGRTLIGVASLAIGITALTLLTAVTVAFRGQIVGSLLGDAVAVQVRDVDYIAAGATVALGVLAVADVVFLNITERAAELATIRSFGWRDTTLARLIVTEGAIIGVTGSLAGAGLGLGAAAWFAGHLPARLIAVTAAAAAAGILITAAATLLPAAVARRLPAARLLAEE